MSAESSDRTDRGGGFVVGPTFIIGIIVLGGMMVRTGYDLGVSSARKILRRHDKDVRINDKRTKKYLKEMERQKREMEKRFEKTRYPYY